MYNFDKINDRHGTCSAKWDSIKKNGYPADTLAMWTADMDFEVCPAISDALARRLDHHIYGYSLKTPGCDEAVCQWMKERHGWNARPEWIINAPGVVCALKMAIQAFTQPGDAILILRPVYYPFTFSIEGNGRKVVNSPLLNRNGHYEVDFDDFEQKIQKNSVKMFLLCNPHNPVSRVWTKAELQHMGRLCAQYNVMVVSDEIHQDFAFAPHRFVSFLVANPDSADHSIICTAPSKTFNVAGLKYSNIFIPHKNKRELFYQHLDNCGIRNCNLFGDIACQAAYEGGGPWLDKVLLYIKDNYDFFKAYMTEKLPLVKVNDLEGTYLAWVDFSAWGLTDEKLDEFMLFDAHIWLDGGTMFGLEGGGFQRLNLAYPRSIIRECVDRIEKAAKVKKII